MFIKCNKVFIILFFCFFILFVFFRFWPIYFDKPFGLSMRLYWSGVVLNERINVSNISHGNDMVCVIGEYEDFSHYEFEEYFNEKERNDFNSTLKKNILSFSDDSFYLIGFNGGKVSFVYYSNFFSKSKYGERCVFYGEGELVLENDKSSNKIKIKLMKG